tara:strand:+ start:275 stop:607 length:333 start_codon:yes stop_codon:yes gene_type:complete
VSLYKQEFGQDFDLGFDLKEHPYLIDKSWHNDLCPSFYFKVDEQYYVLWVDYADEERREEDTSMKLLMREVMKNRKFMLVGGKIAFQCDFFTELEEWLKLYQTSNPRVDI